MSEAKVDHLARAESCLRVSEHLSDDDLVGANRRQESIAHALIALVEEVRGLREDLQAAKDQLTSRGWIDVNMRSAS